jgi:capsular polysaccharide export protein
LSVEALTPLGGSDHLRPRLPARVYAHGFSLRKRSILRHFVAPSAVCFVRSGRRIPASATLLVWGSNPAPANLLRDVDIIRVEDGFLRSVGLGSALVQPLSWVMDRRGIYYDSTRPSDLEHILQTLPFPAELVARAASLRARIVHSGITKYSVGQRTWRRPAQARRVVLVPGQVETDASLRFASPAIRSNLGLVRAVRHANPTCYLVYKPHPDVEAGLRAAGEREQEICSWCDEIATDVSMGEMLVQVDEVHVLTSLAGFEALLRCKPVTCYGLPFYAGWQLSEDLLPISRRTRRLTLDELVAGALIVYPRYVSRGSGLQTSPECVVDDLSAWRESIQGNATTWQRPWRGALRLTVARK